MITSKITLMNWKVKLVPLLCVRGAVVHLGIRCWMFDVHVASPADHRQNTITVHILNSTRIVRNRQVRVGRGRPTYIFHLRAGARSRENGLGPGLYYLLFVLAAGMGRAHVFGDLCRASYRPRSHVCTVSSRYTPSAPKTIVGSQAATWGGRLPVWPRSSAMNWTV